ncbi:galactokinase [Paludisphaera soli]|uniref:galactokinase n=1 Tax=Paludisphaera soli TaxID=2712865 RepID=UPI0013EC8736|nr:GHMP kinase [Paludisphaera soli]
MPDPARHDLDDFDARIAGSGLFDPSRPLALARAPGRLDVMGGIADYSGSLVLQWPIREAALAAAQQAGDGTLRITSLPGSAGGPARSIELPAEIILGLGDYESLDAARLRFERNPADHWAAYVVGPIAVLLRERPGLLPDRSGGLRVAVRSDVPEGKGVSSSAALEVSVMRAVAGLFGVEIDGAELARLCQVAENVVVGAPCGIMDQMASALGRADRLLALLCQPAEVRGFVAAPPGVAFWGVDSGIRHAVAGSDYSSVRVGAFMGYRMLADLAGLGPITRADDGVLHIEDPRWGGYLANLAPEEFAARFEPDLPESITGAEFLARYGGTTDPVTRVDPARTYAVRLPTAHPIGENARVRLFAELLEGGPGEAELRAMGDLMVASHASYSACGLGSDGTDRLVELVREAGPGSGLYGAKITGGGSGGTVAVLGRADAGDAVAGVARRYERETGREAYVFTGSSPGACAVGVRVRFADRGIEER